MFTYIMHNGMRLQRCIYERCKMSWASVCNRPSRAYFQDWWAHFCVSARNRHRLGSGEHIYVQNLKNMFAPYTYVIMLYIVYASDEHPHIMTCGPQLRRIRMLHIYMLCVCSDTTTNNKSCSLDAQSSKTKSSHLNAMHQFSTAGQKRIRWGPHPHMHVHHIGTSYLNALSFLCKNCLCVRMCVRWTSNI